MQQRWGWRSASTKGRKRADEAWWSQPCSLPSSLSLSPWASVSLSLNFCLSLSLSICLRIPLHPVAYPCLSPWASVSLSFSISFSLSRSHSLFLSFSHALSLPPEHLSEDSTRPLLFWYHTFSKDVINAECNERPCIFFSPRPSPLATVGSSWKTNDYNGSWPTPHPQYHSTYKPCCCCRKEIHHVLENLSRTQPH